jgi:hypothetical protein
MLCKNDVSVTLHVILLFIEILLLIFKNLLMREVPFYKPKNVSHDMATNTLK